MAAAGWKVGGEGGREGSGEDEALSRGSGRTFALRFAGAVFFGVARAPPTGESVRARGQLELGVGAGAGGARARLCSAVQVAN